MSDPSLRLRNILQRNRAALGLSVINESDNSDTDSDSYSALTQRTQDELSTLVANLNLDNNSPKMENIRFLTSLLPTFSGNQEHLESFILAIDEFYTLYFNTSDEQRKLVLAAIKSKLVDDARNFLLSRPDLTCWINIKEALRQKFGDPITYAILMQQLQYFKINKNEEILHFVDRLKSFVQRIVSKIQCEVTDVNSKMILISQVENTSVLILTANSPQTLKTMLMLQRPTTLNEAYNHVMTYNMIESQVNFTNNCSSLHNNIPKQNHAISNQNNRIAINRPFNTSSHMLPPPAPRFPSQPIPIISRPVQRHYPTNSQVFGPRPNTSNLTNRAPRQDAPVPMSISTGGPSRLRQQQTPARYPNFFQATGPRNFSSQELYNVEVQPETSYHYDSHEAEQIYDLPQNPSEDQFSMQYPGNQNPNLEPDENFKTGDEECSENFPELASDQPLT